MRSAAIRPLLLICLATGRVEAQEPAAKAREIIAAAIVARGGKDRLLQLPAWHIKYRELFLQDGKTTIETGDAYEHLARGQARYQTGPDDIIVVNGKQGWIKKGSRVTALTAGQLADFQEYFKGKEAMLTLLPLLTEEWEVSAVGEKEVEGRAAVALRIRRKKWTATTYWDRETHLLVAAEYPHKRLTEPDDGKRKATMREARFGAYKAFAGILFHTQLRAFTHGKQSGRVEFTAIELMKELPRSVTAAPK